MRPSAKVAAVILAAGASKRLGQSKQDIVLGGETLVERSVRIARTAELSPVFVVVSPEFFLSALPKDSTLLVNHDAREGMTSSIRVGVRAALEAKVDAVVILACDQIAVTPEHLRKLVSANAETAASTYAGRNGVPACFSSSVFGELLNLRGDAGARGLLREAKAIPLADGELDIDTPEDLERARRHFIEAFPYAGKKE